ncbi:LysM domain-containing protein [Paraburkholderia sp. Tr-20389]|uniref:hypothetical protein n=1 Tax=Paraburkholderia sp. Tr-20389 TaxID=2703903 RepID=UPI001980EAC7|nr:hypothetical protein [Paraburkholderia sp. Tr-20389]MBN3753674.1 LysM domain-containing protein [Paraburkholderia sp. Tr-20389]
MFFPGSRYAGQSAYTFTRSDGAHIQLTRLPLPGPALVLGYFHRDASQRLDLIASHYMADATKFWTLCDANNSVVPDALAQRELIGIPRNAPVTS